MDFREEFCSFSTNDWENYYPLVTKMLQGTHSGYRITQKQITKATGASETVVRKCMNEALNSDVIIVGSGTGYYRAHSMADIQAQIEQLRHREKALSDRIAKTGAVAEKIFNKEESL